MDSKQEIKETEWKPVAHCLYDIKHIWAEKGTHIYVVPAHRTHGLGLDTVPMAKLTGMQFLKKEDMNTEVEARKMVEEWLTK